MGSGRGVNQKHCSHAMPILLALTTAESMNLSVAYASIVEPERFVIVDTKKPPAGGFEILSDCGEVDQS